MKVSIPLLIALLALSLLNPARAATYTVTVNEDDTFAHDTNPGDGICTDFGGACSLRAAIEEANAHAGIDTILFANAFVNVTVTLSAAANEGPLPPITGRVNILGSTIGAYNSAATLLRDAPPQIFIDGSNLTASNNNGLIFSTAAASGSMVSAIGIVGFPGSGIVAAFGANNLIIERNYIGARANGSAAGNGANGFLAANSSGHRIGKARNAGGTAFTGLGNVISSNGFSGIRLDSSNDNDVRGNLIGIAPSGTGDRGNGSYGIQVSGTGNDIGDYVTASSAGNYIAGNNLGSIFSVGDGNRFYANTLGIGETGGFITSENDGIVVIGTTNFIGNSNRGRNRIVEHAGSAIRLGVLGGTAANSNFVLNNEIGSGGSQFPLLFSGNGAGIYVAKGDTNAILNNIVINSLGRTTPYLFGEGLDIRGNGNTISGNQVGFASSIGGAVAEPNKTGIKVFGDNNAIGSSTSPNLVGGNTGPGIAAYGNGNSIRFNYVGVTSTFAAIGNIGFGVIASNGAGPAVIEGNIVGNNGAGVLLTSSINGPDIFNNYIGVSPGGIDIGNNNDGVRINNSSNIDVHSNRIAYNGGPGIDTNDTASAVAWFQNSMYSNGGLGIDLRFDGPTPNDPGDIDEGPNRLQNFPVIQQAILNSAASPPTLAITYRVDSNSGASGYPMFIDFYWSDRDEPAQGRFFLGTDFSYTTPNALRTVTLSFVNGAPGGWLTATALDADRNTSELAARFQFGNPLDRIFAHGFE